VDDFLTCGRYPWCPRERCRQLSDLREGPLVSWGTAQAVMAVDLAVFMGVFCAGACSEAPKCSNVSCFRPPFSIFTRVCKHACLILRSLF
jgi:hypothetical protein